jgi:hypothetical protein
LAVKGIHINASLFSLGPWGQPELTFAYHSVHAHMNVHSLCMRQWIKWWNNASVNYVVILALFFVSRSSRVEAESSMQSGCNYRKHNQINANITCIFLLMDSQRHVLVTNSNVHTHTHWLPRVISVLKGNIQILVNIVCSLFTCKEGVRLDTQRVKVIENCFYFVNRNRHVAYLGLNFGQQLKAIAWRRHLKAHFIPKIIFQVLW